MEFEKLESDVADSSSDVGWVGAGVGEVNPKSIEALALALAVKLGLAVVLAITLTVELSELDRVSVA